MKNRKVNSQTSSSTDKSLNNLRSLSNLLDNAIGIPGTSYSVGIDPLLGLFPGAGDYLSAFLSAYIVIQGARMGTSKATVSRMVFNIIIDTLIGTLPVLGDLFDFAWKANNKNIILLENTLKSPGETKQADWWFVILLLAVLLLTVILAVSLSLWLLSLIFQAILSF